MIFCGAYLYMYNSWGSFISLLQLDLAAQMNQTFPSFGFLKGESMNGWMNEHINRQSFFCIDLKYSGTSKCGLPEIQTPRGHYLLHRRLPCTLPCHKRLIVCHSVREQQRTYDRRSSGKKISAVVTHSSE